MKRNAYVSAVVICLAVVWTVADAHAFWVVTRDLLEEEKVTETDLIRTVDNFIILLDTSGSANKMVSGKSVSRIQAVKTMLKERNTWFPELGHKAGIYVYTNRFKKLDPIIPMQVYNRNDFAAAIDRLPDEGSGPTLMQWGLIGLKEVLSGLSGKTAIVMLSDGAFTESNIRELPYQIAQEIARDHDVCFYLVSSASEERNAKMIEAVSKINACSRVVPLVQFLDNPHYLSGALYTIKTTSYTRLRPTTQVVGFIAEDMLFDFDSPAIRDTYYEKIGILGAFLQNNPDGYVVAGGYTDSVGDPEYNLALSERRVESFKQHLVDQFNIDPNRIVTLWFGEDYSVADNGTAEGRQLNRRVQMVIGGVD